MVFLLRLWLLIVSLGCLAVAFECFYRETSTILSLLYNNNIIPTGVMGKNSISGLTCRIFGSFSLVLALITGHLVYEVHNKRFYSITLMSYMLSLGHFISELVLFQTVKLSLFPIVLLVVLGLTVGAMVFVYPIYIHKHSSNHSHRANHTLRVTRKSKRE
jgi:hypothetical protein